MSAEAVEKLSHYGAWLAIPVVPLLMLPPGLLVGIWYPFVLGLCFVVVDRLAARYFTGSWLAQPPPGYMIQRADTQ